MPLPITLAHKLMMRHAELRFSGELPFLRPDAKSQVTVAYDSGVEEVEIIEIYNAADAFDLAEYLADADADHLPNIAELAAGTMTEVTIPPTHRWIPKGMTVNYLAKATTDLCAVATPASPLNLEGSGDYTVAVDVRDDKDKVVFSATITMWISPRRS